MGSKVRDLAPQGSGGGRAPRGVGFDGVDLAAKVGNLAAGVGVGGFELLDAPYQDLVAGDLVGRVQELRLDLARQDKTGGQGDDRNEGETRQLLS